jgi:hypothetical protein
VFTEEGRSVIAGVGIGCGRVEVECVDVGKKMV